MAISNDAVLKVGNGHFYTAPVGTPRPTDLLNLGDEWEHMGHTSLEDILQSNVEGGESTLLGSLQNRNLKTSYSARSQSFQINLLQFNEDSLQLYYGANATVTADGDFEVPETAEAEERAWLFLFFDGPRVGGIYAAKASFMSAEPFSISDTESLASLPLTITPLRHGSSTSAFRIIPPREIEGAEAIGEPDGGDGS